MAFVQLGFGRRLVFGFVPSIDNAKCGKYVIK